MRCTLRSILIALGLLFIWQMLVLSFDLPPYLLPSPSQVFNTLYTQYPLILTQASPTFIETVLGFLLGVLLGCFAGCMVSFYRSLANWFLPILIISQAIPIFAIAPLLVIWLGYGLASKIATTVLMIFFPVASALYDGLSRTQHNWVMLAQTMHASKWRFFWHIRLPAALPALSSGIRIAAVTAPIGAIVGEWVGSSQGLGYLMLTANGRMQIDLMFAALTIIIVMALILYFSVDRLLKHWVWWS